MKSNLVFLVGVIHFYFFVISYACLCVLTVCRVYRDNIISVSFSFSIIKFEVKEASDLYHINGIYIGSDPILFCGKIVKINTRKSRVSKLYNDIDA